MNLEIKLLAHCPELLSDVATLWFEELGKIWVPHASIARGEQNFHTHLNENDLPLTFVAIHDNKLIGTVSLRANDGICSDLKPWLGSLIVHPDYRRQKIGEKLINRVKLQALKMNYKKLFLLTLDPTIPNWYSRLGWRVIGKDHFCHHPVVVMQIEI